MLEKERFLEIKKIAHDIRNENKELFESLSKLSLEEAIEEKEEFIENVINNAGIEFSEAEKGKEEKQIFRANVLIPDDVEFFQMYSKDKNIRNLMNKYLVNVEDIMSKITELNIYGKYIDTFNEEKEEEGFVEEMTKETNSVSNDAMNLLEEVKSLTSDIDATLGELEEKNKSFDFNNYEPEEETILDEPEEKINLLEPEEIPSILTEKEPKKVEVEMDYSKDTEEANLADMSTAVSSFIDEYNALKKENNKMKEDLEKLQNKNSELSTSLTNQKNRANELEEENIGLKVQNQKLQAQITESKVIISKIYSCIAPKE